MDEVEELWEPVTTCLNLHPDYLALWQEAVDYLFYGDAPLNQAIRHYLAMMAASRHQCQYMLDVHKNEFIRMDGDPNWLKGLDFAPVKIQKMDTLNRLMAHQPWMVTSEHIKDLTSCPSPSNWSLTELSHGAAILSHVHAMCSMIMGAGISSSQPPSPSLPPDQNEENRSEVEVLMQRMKDLQTTISPEENARNFQVIADEHETHALSAKSSSCSVCGPSEFCYFTKDINFEYVEFMHRPDPANTPTFKIHDYSWNDHGCSLVAQLSGPLSCILSDKFKLTESLTYYTMGSHMHVDTSRFRKAVWMYIQSLYGIRHDDYNYADVNSLVLRNLKQFIRKVCIAPHTIHTRDRSGVMADFTHSERIHVVLMVLEARMQSQLLHFLRAVTRFMT